MWYRMSTGKGKGSEDDGYGSTGVMMVLTQGVESGQSPSLEGEEGPVKSVAEQEWYGIGWYVWSSAGEVSCLVKRMM